ncbi:rhomboid family intramembrane serine protease [Mycolicibacterium sp.]|jgi:membrane associated rhomboid family serine protease|uniref:rhomboid family intramembrane serine protease n=1 Tax=Mycolicibacterium sp. TaxID=2320850 RepID=UPI0028AE27B7|nr:rhomboid family intramembrane serine protease [Mycolicibacterium sp.]
MGLAGQAGQPPPTRDEKWPGWKVGGATILTFVALLYLIELVDLLTGHSLDRNGIRPLETDGLKGILFAPLLHADWGHLVANTVPALVLGFLVTLAGMSRFVWATAIIWILGGLGTWLLGNIDRCPLGTNHVGASGLIFGWLGFLLVFGWLTRHVWQILISLAVLFIYGGILWGAVPALSGCGGVSWQGHLSGAVAGVLAAYWLSKPEREARRRRGAATPPGPLG